jgi:hypothetical protein
MGERVLVFDPGVKWEPNTEHGILVTSDAGEARLRLHAHPTDADQRDVVLAWDQAWASRMEPPNDEARNGHRLYAAGLRDVLWMGEVLDSALIADLEMRNRVHPSHDPARFATLRHWVVLLKGNTVEVVARFFRVTRPGQP